MRESDSWYQRTILSDCCDYDTHCKECFPSGDCDICGTIDGRVTSVVNDYASTCDGLCAELTHHDHLAMDKKTQLGYCDDCIPSLSQEIRERLENKRGAEYEA